MDEKVNSIYEKMLKDRGNYSKLKKDYNKKLSSLLKQLPRYEYNELLTNFNFMVDFIDGKPNKPSVQITDSIFNKYRIRNWADFINYFIFDFYMSTSGAYNLNNYLFNLEHDYRNISKKYTVLERYFYILIAVILTKLCYINVGHNKIVLYRGITLKENKFKKVFQKKGKFSNSRFTSTSLSPFIGANFHGSKDDCCFLILKANKDIPFIPISSGRFKEELEILLPPYLDYEVINYNNKISNISIKDKLIDINKNNNYSFTYLVVSLKKLIDVISFNMGTFTIENNYVINVYDKQNNAYPIDNINTNIPNSLKNEDFISYEKLNEIKNLVYNLENLFT